MITLTDEAWATTTLRDAQDPGAGTQEWKPVTRLTLERYNLIFSQKHSRGYAADGLSPHDAATVLENSLATLFKIALESGVLKLTKWSVASGLDEDDVTVVADANLSDYARPSIELTAGNPCTVRIFYVDEDDNFIHYIDSADGGANFGAEADVGALSNLKAIASVSTSKVHCISYSGGNTRFHCYELNGSWAVTNSLLYWPHLIEHIDAVTIGTRDLIVFYSRGPMYGNHREAGIYGLWYKHGRWSDLFKVDALDESDAYAYRQHPMISTANSIYFLTGYLSEGDADNSQAIRFLKTSKDGQHWSQYQPLVTCTEAGPAKLLVVEAAAGQSWPWSPTGKVVYVVGYDKVYGSNATRVVGEENSALQVDVTSRTTQWTLTRGAIAQGNTVLANHDGTLDNHAMINDDNSLLMKREAGYRTGAGDEYAQLALEVLDLLRETDRLPRRHKQAVSRDFMAWMRDKKADHYEEWLSQLLGYDNYHDDVATGRGGLSRTAIEKGRWETAQNKLWLTSDNNEGIAFATWGSRIMNGQYKAMIRIETAGNDEYAGVLFRAHDEGNFMAAYYDQATDKIHLRQKYNNVWLPIVASSAALSWAIDTWYGIMVDFRYGYVRVFYSTDGLSWSLAFVYVIPYSVSNPLPEYGYVGLVGYGYSTEDVDDPPEYEPPLPPPFPSPPARLGPPGPAVAGHSVDGCYYTPAWGDDWEQRNSGMATTTILSLIWDPWWLVRQGSNDPEDVILLASGVGFIEKKVGTADWEDITPSNDPPNTWGDVTPPTATTVTYKQLHGDIHTIDTFYALVEWQEPDSGNLLWRAWIAKTVDNGISWTWTAIEGSSSMGVLFEDDFPGAALDGAKWTTVKQEAGCTIGVADGILTLYCPEDGVNAEIELQTNVGAFANVAGDTLVIEIRMMVYTIGEPAPPQFYVASIYYGPDGGGDYNSVGFVKWATYESALYTAAVLMPPRTWTAAAAQGDIITDPTTDVWYKSTFTIPSGGPLTHQYDGLDSEASTTPYNGVVTGNVGIYIFSPGGLQTGDSYMKVDYVRVTGGIAAATEVRPLAMDLDTEDGSRLYVTIWKDGNMYCNVHSASDLARSEQTSFGAATEVQVAAKTYWVAPRAPHVPDSSGFGAYVYVFGRYNDGAEKHLAYSSDTAATFANVGEGTWDANHRVGAIDVLRDNLEIWAFVNHATTPRLWRTINRGTAWTNHNSIPFNVEFEAQYRCHWSEDEEFLIGSNAAGAQMAAWLDKDYTTAWNDCTGSPGLPTAAGVISAIIWV